MCSIWCRAAATVKYTRRDVMAGADLVFHAGDISYADGREYVWNSFMAAIEPAASRVPYMVAVGAALGCSLINTSRWQSRPT